MRRTLLRSVALLPLLLCVMLVTGCASSYKEVVRPTPRLASLSPELANLTDEKIELYLRSNVKPVFPTVLAIAKIRQGYYSSNSTLEPIRGAEAEGWMKLEGRQGKSGRRDISQIQFINPLLMQGEPSLKRLRDAAALVHAPMLLVYLEAENCSEGYNDAAIAYWSIVGLFTVPGNTVGHYTVCYAVLVDTRTGFILATAQSDSARKENVLPGAVDIARDRVAGQTQTEAVAGLQKNFKRTFEELARSKSAGK